jgi:Rieske Fe-S protein
LEDSSNILSNTSEPVTRRGFLKSIVGVWTAVLSLPFIYAVASFIIPPGKKFLSSELRRNPGLSITKIPIENLAENSSIFANVEGEPVLVIRKEGIDIIAYSAICTHLNCIIGYRKTQKDIFCNCHASSFSLDGNALNGPARLPLKRYKVSIENDVIKVSNI